MVLRFKWNENGDYSYVQSNEVYELSAKDASKDNSKDNHKIKYFKPNEAQEMLSVYIVPDGNKKAQVEHLKVRVRFYADVIRTISIYKTEAWIALTTMAFKSIEYCLPVTQFQIVAKTRHNNKNKKFTVQNLHKIT